VVEDDLAVELIELAHLAEHLLDLLQARDEPVDLLRGSCTGRSSRDSSRPRRAASSAAGSSDAGADRDPLPVEHLGDVVRVDAVDVERDESDAAVGGGP
jgi:hypothetical protein